jgi:chromate transport protein ChrA
MRRTRDDLPKVGQPKAPSLAAIFVGSVLRGYSGAAVAVCGAVMPGFFAVLALAIAYARLAGHSRFPHAGLHGLTAGAVGVMASLVINAGKSTSGRPCRWSSPSWRSSAWVCSS